MDILEAFRIDYDRPEHVTLVGGGGKTTAMFAMAQALKQKGCKVLVTTTTNIFYPEAGQCDTVIMDSSPTLGMFTGLSSSTVVCLGGGVFGDINKVKSIDPDFLDALFAAKKFDHILVEADGAKRKPIKAPAEYEPVVPLSATAAIGVVGMDVLGLPAEEKYVHRLDKFCELTGISEGADVDEKTIVNLIKHCNGLFKGVPANTVKTVLLNKADTETVRKRCATIADLMKAEPGVSAVVSASMDQPRVYECYRSLCR